MARDGRERPGWARSYLAFALLLALVPGLMILGGALATKFGLVGWERGFRDVMVTGPRPGLGWAPAFAFASLAASVIGLIVGFVSRLWGRALLALAISIATIAAFGMVAGKARQAPPIHDVSTDWTDPPMFSPAVMDQRKGANPVERSPMAPDRPGYAGKRVAEVNAQSCAAARTLHLGQSVQAAYAEAKEELADAGFEIVTDDPAAGRLEAVAESFWYGFKDDVVVRVRPEGVGSTVDIRSVSRVGMSDLGANCKRVTELLADIRD